MFHFSQKLPNFGPYLEERKLAIANYKKKLTDLKDNTPPSRGSRINTPKKPVPAVKVRVYLHNSWSLGIAFEWQDITV